MAVFAERLVCSRDTYQRYEETIVTVPEGSGRQ